MSDRDEWLPDRTKFKDSIGKYLTQSLFLENGYDTQYAMYTLNDEDKEYKGQIYKSLRKLYLQEMDPTEYQFATKYLWGWDHWKKIQNNAIMQKHVDAWREELEVKLRSLGVKYAIASSADSFNAAKWVADGGWRGLRGRPSKAEKEREKKMRERVIEGLESDSDRILHLVRKSDG